MVERLSMCVRVYVCASLCFIEIWVLNAFAQTIHTRTQDADLILKEELLETVRRAGLVTHKEEDSRLSLFPSSLMPPQTHTQIQNKLKEESGRQTISEVFEAMALEPIDAANESIESAPKTKISMLNVGKKFAAAAAETLVGPSTGNLVMAIAQIVEKSNRPKEKDQKTYKNFFTGLACTPAPDKPYCVDEDYAGPQPPLGDSLSVEPMPLNIKNPHSHTPTYPHLNVEPLAISQGGVEEALETNKWILQKFRSTEFPQNFKYAKTLQNAQMGRVTNFLNDLNAHAHTQIDDLLIAGKQDDIINKIAFNSNPNIKSIGPSIIALPKLKPNAEPQATYGPTDPRDFAVYTPDDLFALLSLEGPTEGVSLSLAHPRAKSPDPPLEETRSHSTVQADPRTWTDASAAVLQNSPPLTHTEPLSALGLLSRAKVKKERYDMQMKNYQDQQNEDALKIKTFTPDELKETYTPTQTEKLKPPTIDLFDKDRTRRADLLMDRSRGQSNVNALRKAA